MADSIASYADYPDKTSCGTAFRDAVTRLPGVRDTACSDGWTDGFQGSYFSAILQTGAVIEVSYFSVDFDFFELYGVKAVAGRLFSREHPGDAVFIDTGGQGVFQAPIVINETAAKAFGFPSATEAIGKNVTFDWGRPQKGPSTIIGVVPDVALDAIHTVIAPQIYCVNLKDHAVLHVKLNGRDTPETLDAIQGLWTKLGPPTPLRLAFMNEWLQRYYIDVIRQSQLFTAFAGIALFIAGLGLVRPVGVYGGTADQGNRHPQGDGGEPVRHHETAVVAIHQAGAVGEPDRVAGRLVFHEPLATWLRRACGVTSVGLRRGHRNCPDDRSCHRTLPRLQGRDCAARVGSKVRVTLAAAQRSYR